jgi:hypothetical protein
VAITLRTLTDSDLDSLFIWESDPRAVQMAAFTRANPSDRSEFDAHYERVRNDPSATLLAIDDDAEFVGTVASSSPGGPGCRCCWREADGRRGRAGGRAGGVRFRVRRRADVSKRLSSAPNVQG